MTTQFDPTDPTRFEEMYRDDRVSHGLPAATPWDIGGPQPVVQQLVALGAIKGEVLDPGTGPGPPRHLLRVKGLLGHRHRRLGDRAGAGPGERAQSRGVGELPTGRRHEARRAGQSLRHRRRLRFLPHLFDRAGAAAVLRAGVAPRHQAGSSAVHVRVRHRQHQWLPHATVAVRGRLSRRLSRRRLGHHLFGSDDLPDQYELRKLRRDASPRPRTWRRR